jgi:hypothetical protein
MTARVFDADEQRGWWATQAALNKLRQCWPETGDSWAHAQMTELEQDIAQNLDARLYELENPYTLPISSNVTEAHLITDAFDGTPFQPYEDDDGGFDDEDDEPAFYMSSEGLMITFAMVGDDQIQGLSSRLATPEEAREYHRRLNSDIEEADDDSDSVFYFDGDDDSDSGFDSDPHDTWDVYGDTI